jgi:transcriptional regulator with XRE-family HTH domain
MEHTVNCQIGRRLRRRRIEIGLTLQAVGDEVGVTMQQIQKFESGIDSMTATRLWEVARALRLPVGYLFEDCNSDDRSLSLEPAHDRHRCRPVSAREKLEFARAFRRIRDAGVRSKVRQLTRDLADCGR